MKKRLICILVTAVLLVTLMPGAHADGVLCFVAVNDTISSPSLPGDTSPYYINGILYLPYTAFEANPGGVVVSYNVDQNTFVLFTRNSRLVYDLVAGTVTDEDGNVKSVEVAYKNGVLFIPASAASHFGLTTKVLESETGCAVIRFTTGEQVYDDEFFMERAETHISFFVSRHESQGSGAGEEQDPGQNGEGPGEEEVPGTITEAAVVYLAFAGDAVSEETLAFLEERSLLAAFFLTETQFLEEKELVRSIYAAGHTIGLTSGPVRDYSAALSAANRAMDQAVFCCATVALLPEQPQNVTFCRVLEEPEAPVTLEEIYQDPQTPHLLVCRTDAAATVQSLLEVGISLPQLLETTLFIPVPAV